MKAFFYTAVFFVAVSIGHPQNKPVKVGDTARVPGWEWVDVGRGIADRCGIEFGGTVKVVGINGSKVLLQYNTPNGNRGGTPCRDGIRFYKPTSVFYQMTAKYEAVRRAREARLQLVDTILRDAGHTKTKFEIKAVPRFGWITVMNSLGVDNENGFQEFESSCSIHEGGTVKLLGATEKETLAEYTPREDAYGALCPAGTLFFVENAQLAKWPPLSLWQKIKRSLSQ